MAISGVGVVSLNGDTVSIALTHQTNGSGESEAVVRQVGSERLAMLVRAHDKVIDILQQKLTILRDAGTQEVHPIRIVTRLFALAMDSLLVIMPVREWIQDDEFSNLTAFGVPTVASIVGHRINRAAATVLPTDNELLAEEIKDWVASGAVIEKSIHAEVDRLVTETLAEIQGGGQTTTTT